MATNIGPKIGIDGEAAYRQSINNIIQQAKTLGAEMKSVTSAFNDETSAEKKAADTSKVLAKQIDVQKQRVSELEKGLKASAEKFGENDTRTLKWKEAVNNANAELNKMQNELEETNRAAESGGKGLSGFLNVAKAVGTSLAAIVGAVGSAAVALSKKVIEGYGDYEQLVGGIETLFGTGGQSLEEYAKSVGKSTKEVSGEYKQLQEAESVALQNAGAAYQTAGMAMNDYMETITSFAASLKRGLGGDTVAAAKKADLAITDISDNVNKMGSDMASVTDAYQGFAKQNYTMLDNLKLGYGGTASEMVRLIKESGVLGDAAKDLTTKNLNEKVSFDQIVDAIHAVQDNMGITGTTAKEAADTIQGSIGSLSAAWNNFIVILGSGSDSIYSALEAVVDSFKNVVKNIEPVLQQIIDVLPYAVDGIAEALVTLAPSLLSTATAIFTGFLGAFKESVPLLLPAVLDMLVELTTAINDNIGDITQTGITIVNTITEGIIKALPTLIPSMVQATNTITQTFAGNLPTILQLGLELIQSLLQGILNALPLIIDSLPGIVLSIVNAILLHIPQLIEMVGTLISAIAEALPDIIQKIVTVLPTLIDSIISAILEALPLIVEAGIELLVSLIHDLPTIISTIVKALPQLINGIINAIVGNIDKFIEAGIKIFVAIVENLPAIIAGIVEAIPQILDAIIEALGDGIEGMADAGENLLKGIWQGISDGTKWLWEKLKEWCGSLVDKVKELFGIHSPSKIFENMIGKNIVLGMEVGIDKNVPKMIKNTEDALSGLTKINISSANAKKIGETQYGRQAITINVNGAQGQNVNDIANVVLGKLENQISRKGAIYGYIP